MNAISIFTQVREELATPLLLFVLRGGGAAAAFGTSLLMVHNMDAAKMGIALTCMSIAPLTAILVTGSSEAGCVRFIIAYLEKNDSAKARGMVRFNRQITLALGSLTLCGLLLWHLLMAKRGYEIPLFMVLTIITAVLLGWLRIGAAHAMSLGKVIRSLAPFSFFRQLLLLLGLGFWVLIGKELTIQTVVATMLVSVTVVLALQAALNRRPMQQLGHGEIDVSDRKEWTKVGLQLGLTLLFVQFSRDLTLVIGAFSLSPADISVLGIATAIVGFAKFFVIAVNQSVTPKLSQAIARDDTEELMLRVAMTNQLNFWPMVLAFFMFWVFGDQVAAIFGPDFSDIAVILLILMIEPLALAYFGPCGNLLSLSGHQYVLLPLSAVAVLLLTICVTVGAQLDGLRGAAIGSSITWLFWSASLGILCRKYTKHNTTLLSSTLRNLK